VYDKIMIENLKKEKTWKPVNFFTRNLIHLKDHFGVNFAAC